MSTEMCEICNENEGTIQATIYYGNEHSSVNSYRTEYGHTTTTLTTKTIKGTRHIVGCATCARKQERNFNVGMFLGLGIPTAGLFYLTMNNDLIQYMANIPYSDYGMLLCLIAGVVGTVGWLLSISWVVWPIRIILGLLIVGIAMALLTKKEPHELISDRGAPHFRKHYAELGYDLVISESTLKNMQEKQKK